METNETERRARGVRRVDFSTLVEICGRDPNTPAFEAEAIGLSGRGMQVRTRFLPKMGAPLVLRFEHESGEAVVEGEVAWRKETDKGGEFGVKFTALDSNSVRVLRQACADTTGRAEKNEPARATPKSAPRRDESAEPGALVRLHIAGLGAPMKARVFENHGSRVHVGSQLEFLRVGRALELEDAGDGDKRLAEIDSVSVAIDPQTQIPQLIVALRYEDEEDVTPEPSVIGDGDRTSRPKAAKQAKASTREDRVEEERAEEDDEDTDEGMFKGAFAAWASNAGSAMRKNSARFAELATGAASSVKSLASSAAERSKHRPTKTTRRTTSVTASRAPQKTSLKDRPRAQRATKSSKEGEPKRALKPRVIAAGVALLVCVSGAYPLFFAGKSKPAESGAAAPPMQALGQLDPSMPTPHAAAPSPFPAATTLNTESQLNVGAAAVTADVPLFGNQELATLEAAPLTPPPNAAIDEISMAKDQTFAQPVVPSLTKTAPANDSVDDGETEIVEKAKGDTEPNSSSSDTVWQVGRMHLPVIHRLRLDAQGAALQGKKTPSGFQVLVPGRKVMETGATIAKRDDRILSVNVNNTPAGGQVTFRFRKDIPGYKVRLRNDYVEFFVNSENP